MSNPVMPVPLVPLVDDEVDPNAPEPDSERASELRRERDEAIVDGDLMPSDIAGISEQNPANRKR